MASIQENMRVWINPATKAELPPGPWQQEPDKAQWVDPSTGLDCLIVRGPVGSLCGYVGLPPGHPWHGTTDYDRVPASAHGGLTYMSKCAEVHDAADPDSPEFAGYICHVQGPGRPEDVVWIGFDTAHLWDLSPGMLKYRTKSYFRGPGEREDVYRDLEYVFNEVTQLAAQAGAPDVRPLDPEESDA